MGSRRLAVFALALIVVAQGSLVSACASLGIPAACEPLCEESSAEPCQQCLQKEKEKREEARRKREEDLRRAPPAQSLPGGGGGAGGY
jgi:hypothetical protein